MKWVEMFKRTRRFHSCVFILLLFSVGLAACGQADGQTPSQPEGASPLFSPSQGEIAEANSASAPESEQTDVSTITLSVNGKTFEAGLQNTVTAEAFLERLPLTIQMEELNGNEKYFYFSQPLPADSSQPGRVEAGELMLYGGDCLVLFYESFATSYRYTPIGKVVYPADLKAALGPGSVDITITRS